jgi:hypothetical protein
MMEQHSSDVQLVNCKETEAHIYHFVPQYVDSVVTLSSDGCSDKAEVGLYKKMVVI